MLIMKFVFLNIFPPRTEDTIHSVNTQNRMDHTVRSFRTACALSVPLSVRLFQEKTIYIQPAKNPSTFHT